MELLVNMSVFFFPPISDQSQELQAIKKKKKILRASEGRLVIIVILERFDKTCY